MLGGFIADGVHAAFSRTETFESETGVGISPMRATLVSFITLLILFALILFVGKYLWNEVLVSLVPGVKPAKSVFQILGLSILLALLVPGGCQCTPTA